MTRRNPLGVMLIISAIDVLLCAFTAGLTLFFLGSAASATKSEQGLSPGLIGMAVVVHNTPGLVKAVWDACPGQWLPASGCETAATCVCRTANPPESGENWVFSAGGSGQLDAIIGLLGGGQFLKAHVVCQGISKGAPILRFETRSPQFRPVSGCRIVEATQRIGYSP